jgi:hypothetical protein
MNTINLMKEEIRESLKYSTLEEIEDRAGETIDSHLPIYNKDIIEEWQAMPGDYDNRGAAELGSQQGHGIIDLMQLDLYLYYSDLFSQAMEEIKKEEEVSA